MIVVALLSPLSHPNAEVSSAPSLRAAVSFEAMQTKAVQPHTATAREEVRSDTRFPRLPFQPLTETNLVVDSLNLLTCQKATTPPLAQIASPPALPQDLAGCPLITPVSLDGTDVSVQHRAFVSSTSFQRKIGKLTQALSTRPRKDILSTPQVMSALRKHRIELLALLSDYSSDLPPKELGAYISFLMLLFWVDDAVDHVTGADRVNLLKSVLLPLPSPTPTGAVGQFHQWMRCWLTEYEACLARVRTDPEEVAQLMQRITASWNDLVQSMVVEVDVRTLDDYIKNRVVTVGLLPCFEVQWAFQPTISIQDMEAAKTIAMYATLLIAQDNDIVSARKEAAELKEGRATFTTLLAMDKLLPWREDVYRQFTSVARNTGGRATEIAEDWVHANVAWSVLTTRYCEHVDREQVRPLFCEADFDALVRVTQDS